MINLMHPCFCIHIDPKFSSVYNSFVWSEQNKTKIHSLIFKCGIRGVKFEYMQVQIIFININYLSDF